MKIIIEIKDTATLNRINELDKILHVEILQGFIDVIKSIEKEW